MRTLAMILGVGLLLTAGRVKVAHSQQPSTIVIRDFAFQPATLRVTLSGRRHEVRWVNNDAVAHTVTADGGTFDSGALGNGATFAFTVMSAGTYAYHCEIHTRMRGQIAVEQTSASEGDRDGDTGSGY